MNTTKNILIFFSIALILLVMSACGMALINLKAGIEFAGISISIIPIVTLITIIAAHKSKGVKE